MTSEIDQHLLLMMKVVRIVITREIRFKIAILRRKFKIMNSFVVLTDLNAMVEYETIQDNFQWCEVVYRNKSGEKNIGSTL